MPKNKIAIKLALYFTVCLLVFSVVIGVIFMILFRNHTITIHKSDLEQRATTIARTLSSFNDSGHGSQMGYGAYLRFLDDLARTDVWVINNDRELLTRGQGHHTSEIISYKDLPEDADHVIEAVFGGETAFSETFSAVLNQPTITVGTPIRSGDSVIGVVLLHSPVTGTNAAVEQGFTMLGVSMAVALLIASLLSLWLSKNFTDLIVSKEAAEALRLEKLRRDFVANISHELKTPVAVLRGSLEALVDRVVTEPAQVADYHREMLSETLHLQRLVGDLLDLSRLQNADFAIEMQDVILDEIVDDTVRSVSHLAAEKPVSISVQKDDTLRCIRGDYGRLRQMLLIVLDNAVKFSPAGSAVDVLLSGNTLSVRDHGDGVAPEDLPYLFDRFYKSRHEQNKSGTGLGLAIANQIAQRHDIALSAENGKDGGARFLFTLPRTK